LRHLRAEGTRVERARPLLGTKVAIAVEGLGEAAAHRAIDAAFAEVSRIHDLMSFHQAGSDVSRLNRQAADSAVTVDFRTMAVLQSAQRLAEASGGCFDITTAAQLVTCGALPDPGGVGDPDATWRDIELRPDANTVRFARALSIDLGGIAKGYAVDRAVVQLGRRGVAAGCVNAGGDLRVFGRVQLIRLDPGVAVGEVIPILELEEGSVASSGALGAPQAAGGAAIHFDGISRQPVQQRFACVVARDCVWADGLTKVVLAKGQEAEALLGGFQAGAYLFGPDGVRVLGGDA
jgi:thiamine biosynthesis lipoprotein